jgi:hypothetical protein
MKTEGFSLGDRLQEHRMLKNFYVTYVRAENPNGSREQEFGGSVTAREQS